jgi:hypothetical protein
MKHKNADITKNNGKNPVRENKPTSISDDLKNQEKKDYPFHGEKERKEQPEFIEPNNRISKNK